MSIIKKLEGKIFVIGRVGPGHAGTLVEKASVYNNERTFYMSRNDLAVAVSKTVTNWFVGVHCLNSTVLDTMEKVCLAGDFCQADNEAIVPFELMWRRDLKSGFEIRQAGAEIEILIPLHEFTSTALQHFDKDPRLPLMRLSLSELEIFKKEWAEFLAYWRNYTERKRA